MEEDVKGATGPRKRGRGFLWAFLAVLIAFGGGYGWQWYEAQAIRDQLTRTEQELRIERLRVGLAQAAVAAQAANFEAARQEMSHFFTRLQEASDNLPPDLAALAGNILAQRDDVITGLSRSNPGSVDVLYRMLERFEAATGETAAGTPAAPPPESAAGTAPATPASTAPTTPATTSPAVPTAPDSGRR